MAVKENTGQAPVIVIPGSSKDKIIDYAVKGGLLVLLLWGAKKGYEKLRHNAEENKTGGDPSTQQAMSLRSAMNPSGFEWLRSTDGTDEQSIFNTAKDVKDLEDVIKAYRKLYSNSLMDDLKREMETQSYARLLNIFKFGKNTAEPGKNKSSLDYRKGLIVIAKGQVNIRKTPRAYGTPLVDKLLIYGHSNIIKTVDAGTAIGVATARSSFDGKAEPSGVLFIEVTILKTGAAVKDSFTAWVAASQVETITAEQFKAKKYPTLTLTKAEYDKASATLSGTDSDADYNTELITVAPASVLDEKFQVSGKADSGIILGYPIMELSTKENVFVKFLTIDGTKRWVNKQLTKTTSK